MNKLALVVIPLALLLAAGLVILELRSGESARGAASGRAIEPLGRPAVGVGVFPEEQLEAGREAVDSRASLGDGEAFDLVVRILRADGEPAGEARAWLFEMDSARLGERLGAAMRERRDLFSDDVLALGEVLSVDEQGVVRLRSASGRLAVLSRFEDQRGSCEWQPGRSTELELRLQRVHELAVRVLDADGRPAIGVPLRFNFSSAMPYSFAASRAVSSAPEGIARFTGITSGGRSMTEAFLAAEVVSSEPDWRALSLDPWPVRPVELRLPPTGEVLVEVAGLPAGAHGRCELSVVSGEGPGPSFAGQGSLTSPIVDGEARFPLVELGLKLEASVHPEGASNPHRVRGPGPEVRGETRTLRLDLSQLAILVGRLLDTQGEAVARGSWKATVASHDGVTSTRHGVDLHTDAQGRFRFLLADELHLSVLDSLRIEPRFGSPLEQPGGAEPLQALVELPENLGPGVHDLGDVQLTRLPALAAGRVVDQDGDPVAAAIVDLEELEYRSADGAEESWSRCSALKKAQRSAADGSFRLPGQLADVDARELRLVVTRDDYFQGEREGFAPGSVGLVVVLEQAGALAYDVVLPEGTRPRQWPSLTLTPEGSTEAATPLVRDLERSGGLAGVWESIPPGVYSLRVEHDRSRAPLFELAGVVIPAGRQVRDPRLLPLDLRASLHTVRVTVVDEGGGPFAPDVSFYSLREHGARSRGVTRSEDGGYLLTLPTGDPREIVVASEGYRSVRIPRLDGDRRVVMSKCFAVDLRLSESPPLPTGGRGLELVLERKLPGVSFQPRFLAPRIEGDPCRTRELHALFHEGGSYSVVWRIVRRMGSATVVDRRVPGGEIQVDEQARGRVIELTPPETLWEER